MVARELLFRFAASLLQGCPLSGNLLVVALDGVLGAFAAQLSAVGGGEVRTPADDLGFCLSEARALVTLKPIFEILRRAAYHCVAVPLAVPFGGAEACRAGRRCKCP